MCLGWLFFCLMVVEERLRVKDRSRMKSVGLFGICFCECLEFVVLDFLGGVIDGRCLNVGVMIVVF